MATKIVDLESGEVIFANLLGGSSLAGDVTFENDVIIDGTLYARIAVFSEEVNVEDNYVSLNSNVTGTPTENAGVRVVRGTSPAAELTWNETTEVWEVGITGTLDEVLTNANLTTQYRLMIVDADGRATESSSIVTDASGNLGVGGTPTDSGAFGRALDVKSATGGGIYCRDTDAPTTYTSMGQFANICYIGAWGAANVLTLYSAGTEKARITSAGALLIGATTPVGTEKLHVAGSIYATGSLGLGVSPATKLDVQAVGTTSASFGLRLAAGTNASDYCASFNNAAGSPLMRITGSGFVGIGATAPVGTEKLRVAGGVNFSSLPTSDPSVAGELWNDSGTVKISAG